MSVLCIFFSSCWNRFVFSRGANGKVSFILHYNHLNKYYHYFFPSLPIFVCCCNSSKSNIKTLQRINITKRENDKTTKIETSTIQESSKQPKEKERKYFLV